MPLSVDIFNKKILSSQSRFGQYDVLLSGEAGGSEFTVRPTVNGTGVLLSGEAAGLPETIVYTTGNQTISGNKTFANDIMVQGAVLVNQVIDITTTGSISGVTGEFQYLRAEGGMISGDNFNFYAEDIVFSGLNLYVIDSTGIFTHRPLVNGTGVLLSGEAASLPDTIVYTTGDQAISGLKNFAIRPTVNTVPVALSGEASSNIEQWVKNDYGATLYKAQPVYVSGSNGNNILIHPASNSGEPTSSKTFGLLKQTLLNNGQGYVITEGPLLNVDTSMAVEGDPIWLGPTGNLIYGLANKPKAPQHLVSLGFVERAHQTQGKIFVKVQNGFEIEELHDVRIVNKQDDDVLSYNSASGLWLNISKFNSVKLNPTDAPISPMAGQIYFSSGDNHFYGYNGTEWKQLDN